MADPAFSSALQELTGMPDPLAFKKAAPIADPFVQKTPPLVRGGGIFKEEPVAAAPTDKTYEPPVDIPLPELPDYETTVAQPARLLSQTQQEYETFLGEKEADKAKREASQARRKLTAADRYRTDLQAEQIRKERDAFESQLAKPFVPTQQNFTDLATMYSLIGVLGFAIGAGGKGNAIQAMSAMNGMVEGARQGREDLYEKEKDAFEYNAKALQTKINSLNSKIKEIAELAKVDYEKADLEADVMFAEEGAEFLKKYKDKVGLVNTIKMLQEQVKAGEKLYELRTKEITRIEEINKKARDRFEENIRNIEVKREIAEQTAELRTWLATQSDTTRRELADAQETLRRDLAAKDEAARKERDAENNRVRQEMQRERIAAEERSKASERSLRLLIAQMNDRRARDKADTKLDKIPQKDRDAYQLRETTIPALESGLQTLDRLQKEGKWKKMTGLLAIDPRAAEAAFSNDPEALSLIRTFARFRSAEFETAGKALTKMEDKILSPLYRSDLRTYEATRNAMDEGLKEMKRQKQGLENQFPSLKRRAEGEVELPTPKNQKEFDALKKGDMYIDPDDGRVYRKK
jgi:hypothetical protein